MERLIQQVEKARQNNKVYDSILSGAECRQHCIEVIQYYHDYLVRQSPDKMTYIDYLSQNENQLEESIEDLFTKLYWHFQEIAPEYPTWKENDKNHFKYQHNLKRHETMPKKYIDPSELGEFSEILGHKRGENRSHISRVFGSRI